ncbi:MULTISPECIES: NAD(P)/FAD-dependent oxidoreductase [unclassified Agarivorans]|uniref:NAD(P)/FAD-dependent oxidoreductase n=1 Tax=unclassified Agarivorans TaxID=2636026 RepID=UPI003D7E7E44
MSHIVVLGAGLGGLAGAYDLRNRLGKSHQITVVNEYPAFHFVPSNPWVAVGWRKPEQICIDLLKPLTNKQIDLVVGRATLLDAAHNRLEIEGADDLQYDYLVIATGPKLAFELIEGAGPVGGFTQSVCTLGHSIECYQDVQKLIENPGPVVVGAFQGASCFGPAYEYALILDKALRDAKIRHKVPMTFVSPEPYIGHLGLGGVADSKSMLESQLRNRHIKWVVNAKVERVSEGSMRVAECDHQGELRDIHDLAFVHAMLIPPFKGVEVVAQVPELCNEKGFVKIDEFQRSPHYPNIFSAGVCVAIPPVEVTPVPLGTPKTGYMIESMMTAIAENIHADLTQQPATAKGSWNAVCLADTGDGGIAFVAMPQIPPRNVTWFAQGKWVHLAKVGFEKYFMHKMRAGTSETFYEKFVMKKLGIERLEDE